jgi:hypothetical protein
MPEFQVHGKCGRGGEVGSLVKITAEMGGKAKEQIPSPAGIYTI